jgi:ATP-dependent protease HslVU (ClpYQ) peptidase subunit
MTTIVADFKAGTMCADSQWTDGEERGPARKVHRIKGALIGLAGDLDGIFAWLKAYRSGAALPKCNATAMLLDETGIHTWTALDGWIPMPSPWAIGSGGKLARAAMMAGADAKQAVRIAIQIDASTNGVVRTYRL